MPDPVHLQLDRLGDVVADQLKAWVADPLGDVGLTAREEVVEADDVVAALDEVGAEVGADKARSARDDDSVRLDARLGLNEGGVGALLFWWCFFVLEGKEEERRRRG